MRKLALFALAALTTSSVVGSVAKAESLTCLTAVYTAATVTDPSKGIENYVQQVTIPLVNGDADYETQVNGETVAINVMKKPFVDVYDMTYVLTTPVADRHAPGKIVTMLMDSLYNDGPTKNDGWDLVPSPTAERFMYFREMTGAFSYTNKLVTAMKTAGVWKTEKFPKAVVGINEMQDTIDFIKDQLTAGKMKPTDVVGLATMLTCTREK